MNTCKYSIKMLKLILAFAQVMLPYSVQIIERVKKLGTDKR